MKEQVTFSCQQLLNICKDEPQFHCQRSCDVWRSLLCGFINRENDKFITFAVLSLVALLTCLHLMAL